MDFKQIEAFVNVVKYKGFSKAAEASFLTQPTISAHINALEQELDMQLIDRISRKVTLTPEGRLFYNYALTMLNTREKAVHSLRNFSMDINGTVAVETSSIPGEYIVPKLIAKFKEEYPKVGFTVTQTNSSNVAENIRGFNGEIGFSGHREDNELEYCRLCSDSSVLITPDNEYYRKMQKRGIGLRDIVKEPFILRLPGSGTQTAFEKSLEENKIHISAINVVARMNSMTSVKQAVKCGLGVSVISEMAAERNRENNGYLVIDIEGYDEDRAFYMVYNSKITMAPTAEAFKYFVLDYFESNNNNNNRWDGYNDETNIL